MHIVIFFFFFWGGGGEEKGVQGRCFDAYSKVTHRSRYSIVVMYPWQVYDVQFQLRVQKL